MNFLYFSDIDNLLFYLIGAGDPIFKWRRIPVPLGINWPFRPFSGTSTPISTKLFLMDGEFWYTYLIQYNLFRTFHLSEPDLVPSFSDTDVLLPCSQKMRNIELIYPVQEHSGFNRRRPNSYDHIKASGLTWKCPIGKVHRPNHCLSSI